MAFLIDEDVDLTSAASGVFIPLTVIGMINRYNKTPGKKGIVPDRKYRQAFIVNYINRDIKNNIGV